MAEQQNWRWCSKCKSIHYALTSGVCAGGRTHDSTTSLWCAIPTAPPADVTQSLQGWRKCAHCQVLFYAGPGRGRCAAGREHNPSDSAEFWLAAASYPAGKMAGAGAVSALSHPLK